MQAESAEPYRLRLIVQRAGDSFEARWLEPEGQESETFPLNLALDKRAKQDLRWYLESYVGFVGAGDRVLAAEVEQKIEDWGRELYHTLFEHAEGARVHMRLMDAARVHRPAILTIGTDEPDVHIQPWEMVRDRRGPLVFQGVTIRRQLRGAGQARRPELVLPLRVLMITSRPKKAGFIDPRNSIAPMLDALDTLPGQVTVDFCEPPTLERLEKMISEARKRRLPFHIVHFDGHGTYLPETGVGVLVFERDEDGREVDFVEGRELGDLLSRLDIPLMILEACRSSALSEHPIFGSVAPALLQSGVGSVIAFSHSVHIEASKLLVERFYAELADGRTVGQALEEARARLRAQPKRWLSLGPDPDTVDLQDWFIPQLYQVGPDPAVLVGQAPPADPSDQAVRGQARRALHGFPPEPMYRFHGRALELLELERAFRRAPAALLTAMGGMGKTALAREAATWWLRTQRFESAVFHSFEQKAGTDRVVQVLGQALEGEGFSSRSTEDQWRLAVDLFHQQKVLFVWDNFESTLPEFQEGEDDDSPLQFSSEERRRLQNLYRELTEGDPAGRLLVTCRPEETGLQGIKKVPLSGLARPDSLHLLSAVLYQESISTDRDGYDRGAIDALLSTLDDHPLSISLVAPHLKTLTPAQIRAELRQGLERFADASAEEERNRSLLASLKFSTRRLSEKARRILSYLAWFEGGVVENCLTVFAELDAEVWEPVRGELVATALIHLEEVGFSSPFIRFHPTLPLAVRPFGESAAAVGADEAVKKRFIGVYSSLGLRVYQAFHGPQPAFGMALLALEEANFRSALHHAFHCGDHLRGAMMSKTLSDYLERAGRMSELDGFSRWLQLQLPKDTALDAVTCHTIFENAKILISQNQADEAIATMRDLIRRLEGKQWTGDENGRKLQMAESYRGLGTICFDVGRPDLALEPAQRAITLSKGMLGAEGKGLLAAALGDLANAYWALGQFGQALSAAERSLAISRERAYSHDIATALIRTAQILNSQKRYAEADALYTEALYVTRSTGDLGLQGVALQHQAAMQLQMYNWEQAVELGREALAIFQKAGHTQGEMGTCDILGSAERALGHLFAAEAWYARARELAEKRKDVGMLAVNAQNVSILHLTWAEQAGDTETRDVHLQRAKSSIQESLAIRLGLNDQVGAASLYTQFGILYRMLGDLERAEGYLRQALQIFESLTLPDIWKVFGSFAEVARARGDTKAADEWQAKCDAELQRLYHGAGTRAGISES